MDTLLFIRLAKLRHSKTYSYNKTLYRDSATNVTVTCEKHGDFLINPYSFVIKGQLCRKCSLEKKFKKIRRKGKKKFIKKSKQIHGDNENRFDYSKVVWKTVHDKVEIICEKHGSFWQRPASHARGHTCPGCSKLGKTAKNKYEPRYHYRISDLMRNYIEFMVQTNWLMKNGRLFSQKEVKNIIAIVENDNGHRKWKLITKRFSDYLNKEKIKKVDKGFPLLDQNQRVKRNQLFKEIIYNSPYLSNMIGASSLEICNSYFINPYLAKNDSCVKLWHDLFYMEPDVTQKHNYSELGIAKPNNNWFLRKKNEIIKAWNDLSHKYRIRKKKLICKLKSSITLKLNKL